MALVGQPQPQLCRVALIVGLSWCAVACAEGLGRDSAGTFGESDASATGGTGEATSESGSGGQGDGDGDATSEEETEPGCGNGIVEEGELCDDGVNEGSYGGCDPGCMSLGPFCGDALANGPELCDDGNELTNDGCLPNCKVPSSCREILDFDFLSPDGSYIVAPKGPDFPFETTCDMSTDGGGWTAIPLAELCSGNLDTQMTAVDAAGTAGIDGMCRPYTVDAEDGHTYYFDVVFPPGFEAFYLNNFVVKANSVDPNTSEVVPTNFVQSSWDMAFFEGLNQSGDLGYGSGDEPGPATSYGAVLQATLTCTSCETEFPAGAMIVEVELVTTLFRMGWGEVGGQPEGWYPWWSGEVYLR